ncbi:hypothetical protein Y032_0041g474 [Ancylostoma ceylanicum]|uniref:Uncharacterized protein n=1 Tax=Ancylostoma ceylanicum TaxID=53326 RepID=A0A016UHK5_9BILA|nr:hypothetical protein Y032_0041g474 [Ancylostoma ceylanicum]
MNFVCAFNDKMQSGSCAVGQKQLTTYREYYANNVYAIRIVTHSPLPLCWRSSFAPIFKFLSVSSLLNMYRFRQMDAMLQLL